MAVSLWNQLVRTMVVATPVPQGVEKKNPTTSTTLPKFLVMSGSPLELTFGVRLSESLTSTEDFAKYRRKLSKALTRLRHELNMIERDTANYHKKKAAAGAPSEDQFNDERYVKYYLLLAERCMLHAYETKAALEFGGDHKARLKKLMGRKLAKAVLVNRQLLNGVKNQPFSLRLVEVYVYAALTEGFHAIFKKRWAIALHAYSLARCGLEFLQTWHSNTLEKDTAKSADDNTVNKLLMEEVTEEFVDPSLRLVAHQERFTGTYGLLSLARRHSSDDSLPHLQPLVALISSQNASFFATPEVGEVSKTVTWRNHVAHVDNDQVAFLISKVEKTKLMDHDCLDDWDDTTFKWQALVDLHQADLDKNKHEDEPEKAQDGAIILTYLKYNMCFAKLKRDCVHINSARSLSTSKLQQNKEVLQFYTSILATVEEIKDLPGVYNDEDLSESLENMSQFFRAQHSVTVAQSYAMSNNVAEALSIYNHLNRVFSVDAGFYKVESFPYNVTSLEQAYELSLSISALLKKTHAMAHFLKETSGKSYVADNVYNFTSAANPLQKIVNVAERGNIAPVVSKAVLFDIAFNYISYSLETTKVIEAAETESDQDKKKSGFFGIFGR